jgi:hypothetical protein
VIANVIRRKAYRALFLPNPYESPTTDTAEVSKLATSRPSALRTVLFGFGGAFVGYVFLTFLANMESWRFYTIRSTLTGETAMSQITQHPADRWIVSGLFVSFVFGGAFLGFLVARRNTRNCPRK